MLTDDKTDVARAWHHFVDMDLQELRRGRDKAKMALARYARMSIWDWDDKLVTELLYWHSLLAELINSESEIVRAGED